MKLRRMSGTFVVIATVLLAILVPNTASAAGAGEFTARINDLRASKGLAPLSTDGRLNAQAQSWAQQMANVNKISHNPNLNKTAGDWKKVGENVGTGGSVDAIFNALVVSAGHYRNMVDPDFNSIGVGVAMGSDGRIYTCHVFAKYPSAGKLTPAAAPEKTSATTAKPAAAPTTAKPKPTNTTKAPVATTTVAPQAPTTEPPSSDAARAASETAPVSPSPRIVSTMSEISAIGKQG